MLKKLAFLFFSLITLGCLGGCTLFSGAPAPEAQQSVEAAATAALEGSQTTASAGKLDRAPTAFGLSDVEVLWEIPQRSVDGFVVRYGYSREVLDGQVKLAAGEVERFDDPVHGMVYHYVLRNVPPDRKVFVTVSAFQGQRESEPSVVLEVEPAVK